MERDYIDSNRAENPLCKADDAEVLRNDNMSLAEQARWMQDLFRKRTQE